MQILPVGLPLLPQMPRPELIHSSQEWHFYMTHCLKRKPPMTGLSNTLRKKYLQWWCYFMDLAYSSTKLTSQHSINNCFSRTTPFLNGKRTESTKETCSKIVTATKHWNSILLLLLQVVPLIAKDHRAKQFISSRIVCHIQESTIQILSTKLTAKLVFF